MSVNDNEESELRKNAGGDVGRTPGKAEGEEGGAPRSVPPNEPGKTPGSAEGEDDDRRNRRAMGGEEFSDPGTARTPDPNVRQG